MNQLPLERLLAWFLGRLHRFLFGALGMGFGLLWVCLSLGKALLVLATLVLGYLIGKWMDEGRSDFGISSRLRRMFDNGEN
jgi:hypothetical protein